MKLALLLLFVIHLVVVSFITVRNRRYRYMPLVCIFFLLTISQIVAIWLPDWKLAGIAITLIARTSAWLIAGASIVYGLCRRFHRARV